MTEETLKQKLYKVLFILAGLLIINNTLIVIPIIFLLYLLSIPLYIKLLSKFSSKEILIVYNRKSNKKRYVRVIFYFVLIFIWSVYLHFQSESKYNYGIFIFGLFLIISEFSTRKYLFVITQNSIIFNSGLIMSDWKIKFLNNVRIYDTKVEFVKLPQVIGFEFESNQDDIARIEEYLKKQLQKKL